MDVRPHDRFSSKVRLSPASVRAYAASVGDDNPLHHDPDFAAGTRFGRVIASGTQTGALLLALTARHFSQGASMLGLEYWLAFKKPVYADEEIELEWLVISVKPSPRLGGVIVDLRGRVRNHLGQTAVGAKGRCLVTDRL